MFEVVVITSYIISFLFTMFLMIKGWVSKDKEIFDTSFVILLGTILIGFILGWLLIVLFTLEVLIPAINNRFKK